MNYEEKRELRLQISQMLADAGLNQAVLKEMVEDTIRTKVDRAVEQCFKRLNSECHSGDFIQERVNNIINNNIWTERYVREAVFKAIQDKVLRIEILGVSTQNQGVMV